MRYRIHATALVTALALTTVGCDRGETPSGAVTESPTAVPGMQGGEATEFGPAVSEQPDV